MKGDWPLTARCSSLMLGLALYPKLPRSSMKFTNLTMLYSHLSCFRISSLTRVSGKERTGASLLTTIDTYDVNVSPDKRTILLHDQSTLLNSLRVGSMLLFNSVHWNLIAAGILDGTF